MNLIILLVVIFIIVLLIGIILILYNNAPVILGQDGGVIIRNNECTIQANPPPDLSFNQCCVIFGNPTNTKYLSSLNLVVSPIAIPYLDVCSGFCLGGYDKKVGKCVDFGPNVDSGQQQFDACSNASKPDGCDGVSRAVAISQTQLLFPSSATNLLCPSTVPCAIF